MKHMTFTLKASLLGKLLLAVAMMIGGENCAWGDTVIFGGTVADGWAYKNSAGTTQSISNSQLYDGGGSYSPKTYTSNSAITISSNQVIKIVTKRSTSSNAPIIRAKYSSDNGVSWSVAKEFGIDDITSKDVSDEVVVDNIVGTYKIQFEFAYVYISSILLVNNDPHPTPVDFRIVGYTATTASLSWADAYGTTPTSWQIKYSTIENFDPFDEGTLVDNIESRSITLSDLIEGTPYYASVRAVFQDGFSSWSNKIDFTPRSEINITVNDGTSTVNTVPIYGGQVKSNLVSSQFIVPSSELKDMQNRQITKLTFYASSSTISWSGATFEVYLKNTNLNSFPTSPTLESWGTNVFNEGTLSVSGGTMVVNFDTPFNYQSGNLLIGFKQTNKSVANAAVSWYCSGTWTGGIGMYSYASTNMRISYPIKVTITSIPVTTAPVKLDDNGYTTFASPWALDLTYSSMPSGLTAYRAKVFEEESKVRFYSDINQEVAANTGVLLAGSPGETYMIPVAASGTTLADNDFLVNEAGGTFEAGDYTYYGMLKNSTPLAFGEFNPETVAIPSNKAYVKVTKAAAAKGFSFVFEDTATAIRTLSEAQPAAGKEVFDLSGRKVMNSSLKKGLYIVGGKKMLVK